MLEKGVKNFVIKYPALLITLVIFIVFSIVSPYFFTVGNMQSLLTSNAVVMTAAIGETLVLLTGGIDLSISTIVSASAVCAGYVMAQTNNIFLGLIVALLVGALFGATNGILIGYFGLTSFITTMGTQLIARGVAFIISQGIAVKGTPESLVYFGFGTISGIPNTTYIIISLIIIFAFALTKTDWGRSIILLGSNKKTAKYCGVSTKFTEMSVYLFAGILGGIAGFISIINLGNAIPGVGDTILLIIIGGVVLGGTSMNGGEGSVIRTIIGVGLLAVLTCGLNILSVPFYNQLILQGILIFVGNGLATKLSKKSSFAL